MKISHKYDDYDDFFDSVLVDHLADLPISKYKHVFEKGYTPNYTAEIFKIRMKKNT